MIGRRDFRRTIAAGAAVAAPSVVPSSALGRDGSVAPGDRIVMGCIGVGRQGGGDMRGFLNEPYARVAAATEQKYANGVRLIHMDMRTAKKRASQFDLLPSIGATVVLGSEGWIYVSREGLITQPAKLASETIGPNEIQVIRSDNHRRNLLNAIRTGRKAISPIDVAARDQMVVQQQYIALCLGKKLRWDPAREEFIGDAEANRMLSRPMRGAWHI